MTKPRIGNWIQTHSGRPYYPQDPQVSDIDIMDIAHALSKTCRFVGQCSRFYSVAEHSVHVSRLVPQEHQLAGLLHDATEAYLGDISRPLKLMLPQYREIESNNWFVIAAAFGLDPELPDCVKEADATMVFVERRALFSRIPDLPDWGHGLQEPEKLPDMGPLGWPVTHARLAFYDRFYELTNRKPA